MLILIPAASTVLTHSADVNCTPWSVFNIFAGGQFCRAETRASRQVMQVVLDFVEIAMASSRMDDKMASQLELLSALDKIEARIISCGFDSGGVVKRLNDMVEKYPR